VVKKLGVGSSWNYYSYKKNLNLIAIDNIVKNTFLNYNIFISSLYIYEYPKLVLIKFELFVYDEDDYTFLNSIINYLKSLLVLKYNKNVELDIKFSRDIFNDDCLIGTYIKKNKDKIRPLLKLLEGPSSDSE
jgi:hypothetical protein